MSQWKTHKLLWKPDLGIIEFWTDLFFCYDAHVCMLQYIMHIDSKLLQFVRGESLESGPFIFWLVTLRVTDVSVNVSIIVSVRSFMHFSWEQNGGLIFKWVFIYYSIIYLTTLCFYCRILCFIIHDFSDLHRFLDWHFDKLSEICLLGGFHMREWKFILIHIIVCEESLCSSGNFCASLVCALVDVSVNS